jgi:hypothetical protein
MRHASFVVLIGLIVSPAALAQTEIAARCALQQPAAPRLMGLGTIMRFQSPAVARADIPRRQARLGGAIDHRYLNDLRAVVRQDDGRVQTFDVPNRMRAPVGERVTLHGSYRSKTFPCSYVPIMIGADLPVS